MDFRDYLAVARNLANGSTEAEWRSGISRAYYAAFHVAGELLRSLNFNVPRADRSHAYVWLRVSNAGDSAVCKAGRDLNDLRGERNRCDYDSRRAVRHPDAVAFVRDAESIVRTLDAARAEPTRTQITEAMKVYERDILHDVTWRP